MPKRLSIPLQKKNIKARLRKLGIDPDTIDLDALIDPKLNFHENWANVLREIGKMGKSVEGEDYYEAQRREYLEQEAQRIEMDRSITAQTTDEHMANETVLPLTEENLEKWAENPSEYDIEGVDYPIEGIVAQYGELTLNGEHGVVAILGMRGTGKTYLMTHTYTSTDSIVWIDPTGAIRPKGVSVLRIDVLPDPDTLRRVYENALMRKKALVIDVSDLKREDMTLAVNLFAETLMAFAKRSKRTFTVLLDEIGEYAEQERKYYADELERMVRIGRNYGVLWVVLATQRPQKANKHILALSEYYVIFRLIHNRDLEAVKDLMGLDSKTWAKVRKGIINQKTGEYLVYYAGNYVWVRGGKK